MQFHRQSVSRKARILAYRLSAPIVLMAMLVANSHAADPLKTPSRMVSEPEASALFTVGAVGTKLISAGERGHVIVSQNQGEQWEQSAVPVSVALTDVSFFDEKLGWLTGHDGTVLKTVDGGKTWKLVLDGFQLNEIVLAKMKQVEGSLELRLSEADDSEQAAQLDYRLGELRYALRDLNDAIANKWTRPLFTISVLDESTVLIGGAFGTLIKTEDGGQNWQSLMAGTKNPQGLHLYDLQRIDNTLYLAGEYGLLRRSIDGGETWDVLASPYEGTFFGVRMANNKLIAFGLQGSAYVSDTAGENWRALEFPTSAGIVDMTQLANGNMIFLANDGGLIVTNANGDEAQRLETEVEGATALYSSNRALWIAGLNGLQHLELLGLNTL